MDVSVLYFTEDAITLKSLQMVKNRYPYVKVYQGSNNAPSVRGAGMDFSNGDFR
jgi:hypothetical protein